MKSSFQKPTGLAGALFDMGAAMMRTQAEQFAPPATDTFQTHSPTYVNSRDMRGESMEREPQTDQQRNARRIA